MARVNVYLSGELAEELRRFPAEINISEVCGAAIRAELAARTFKRVMPINLFEVAIADPWTSGQQLMSRFGLRYSLHVPAGDDAEESVAVATARALDQLVFESVQLAIGGGTQMWSIVRRLTPRNLRLAHWAIGSGSVNQEAPHVHPNFLVSLLSLMYAPRSMAKLVGAPELREAWNPRAVVPLEAARLANIERIIIGTCTPFVVDSGYADSLGRDTANVLEEEYVIGDFLGVFLRADGGMVEPYVPNSDVSHISASDLREHAKREDTIVALVAAGADKVKLIRLALEAKLCNALITDSVTASALMGVARSERAELE